MATFICISNPNFSGFLLSKITAITSPMKQAIILLPASVILQVFMIYLLCHLNGIAFPSGLKRETWPRGCNAWVRQASLNKKLLFILPSPVECFLVKTLHCLFR